METFLRLIKVGGNGRLLIVTNIPDDVESPIVRGYAAADVKFDKIEAKNLSTLWDDKIYDTIIMADVLCNYRGKAMNEVKVLKLLTRHLDPDGRIYVLEHNRITTGKGFVRQELLRACDEASLNTTFYYPYPSEKSMDYVFSDSRGPRGEVMEAAVAEGIFPSLAPRYFVCIKKTDEPEHLLFKRYAKNRTDSFLVSTGIYRTKKGARFVTREPIGQKSGSHTSKMYDHYVRMAELYNGYTMQVAACDKVEGYDAVRIEYMDGVTLEMLLERTLAKDDYETFSNLFRRMADIITSPIRILTQESRIHYSGNADFVEYFGTLTPDEEKLLSNELCLPVTNINGLLKGIWVKERTWIMADYEWLVDFPVPFGYTLFREIDKFFADKPERKHLRDELLLKHDITPQKEAIYDRMSRHFDRFAFRDSNRDEDSEKSGPKSASTTRKGRFSWRTK